MTPQALARSLARMEAQQTNAGLLASLYHVPSEVAVSPYAPGQPYPAGFWTRQVANDLAFERHLERLEHAKDSQHNAPVHNPTPYSQRRRLYAIGQMCSDCGKDQADTRGRCIPCYGAWYHQNRLRPKEKDFPEKT